MPVINKFSKIVSISSISVLETSILLAFNVIKNESRRGLEFYVVKLNT